MNAYSIIYKKDDILTWSCHINPPIKEIKEMQAKNVVRIICHNCNEGNFLIPYGDAQCVNSGFFQPGTAYICNESLSTK